MPRMIFKNVSGTSFGAQALEGVTSFAVDISGDIDRQGADDEKYPKIYGVQNIVGNATVEMGDLWDIHNPSNGFSVGDSQSLRSTVKRKYTTSSSSLTIVIATAYCVGVSDNAPFGDAAGATLNFEFNAENISYS
jgi:hypothetical protein